MNPSNRIPAGNGERGGQFAAHSHAEPEVALTDEAGPPGQDPGEGDDLEADYLEAMVNSIDVDARSEASTDLAITDAQLSRLSDPATQPPIVRWSVSCLPYEGVADRASVDPDPVIRASALVGFGLSVQNRRRLEVDPDVLMVTGRLTA